MNKDYQSLVRLIENKNAVMYSNVSKKSEELEFGSLRLVLNSLNNSFTFKRGSGD